MNDDLEAWVRLVHRPGLGRERLRRLLASFGSAPAVLEAPPSAWRAVLGARAARESFAGVDDAALSALVAEVNQWLAARPARRLLTLGDADYPLPLQQMADPPLLLYAEGRIDLLRHPALAVVGSRQATAQGLLNARAFAREMAQRGWVIVSGLAAGIDAQAHLGALDAGGATLAVVGTGLDRVYPPAHGDLAARIVEHGLLLSEYALGAAPLPAHFPQRNRIIAGLARGTLVVEATAQSGSLITARLAAEFGREVFAVPGSIHSPQSRGCHALLRQGAKLVETAQDLIEELDRSASLPSRRPSPQPQPQAAGASQVVDGAGSASDGDPVMRALGHDPATLDALMARCGWPAHELNARLLELELAGQVARLPGGLFQRIGLA